MRIRWMVSLLSVLAGASALAALDLSGQVAAVRDVLVGRVQTIDGQGDVTKSEKKERRRLEQAGKKLGLFSGEDTKKSLKKAALAVKFIARSKSTTSDVNDCIGDLLDGLQSVAADARAEALAYSWPATKTDKCRKKFDAAMARGDGLMSRGSASRGTNPGKSGNLTVRSVGEFWKAAVLAAKCADQVSPDVYLYNSRLMNDLDRDVVVNDIVYYLSGALGGEPLDVTRRGTDVTPGSFPFTVPAGTSRDLAPTVMTMVLSDPTLPKWQLGDFVNSAFLIETSEGTISSR